MTMDVALPADRYADAEARGRAFYDRALPALARRCRTYARSAPAVVMPLTGNNWTVPFERADQPAPAGERPPDVGWQLASGGYFQALADPAALTGRLFDRARHGRRRQPVVIISEAIAAPLLRRTRARSGSTLKLGERTRRDRRRGRRHPARRTRRRRRAPTCTSPSSTQPSDQITLFVRTSGDPADALARDRSPRSGASSRTSCFLETRSRWRASRRESVQRDASWCCGCWRSSPRSALALAAVGIYGVMCVRGSPAHAGDRHAHRARGHARATSCWLVMRAGGGRSSAIGHRGRASAIGLAAARSLQSVLFGVSATDPLILAAPRSSLVAATTLMACWLPARRAVTVDPARTLTVD